MSYAIFTIYYGVPLTPDKRRKAALELSKSDPLYSHVTDEDDSDLDGYLEEMIDGLPGFQSHYSGSADVSPTAFGVKIGAFDECEHDIAISSLTLHATDEVKAQYQALYDALEEDHRKIVDMFGEPHVFLLVSSS